MSKKERSYNLRLVSNLLLIFFRSEQTISTTHIFVVNSSFCFEYLFNYSIELNAIS
jgi:hypothetical protein